MTDLNIGAIVELAHLKRSDEKKYLQFLDSMKEIAKDLARLEMEVMEEIEDEIRESEKREKENLERIITEKMQRDFDFSRR